MRRFLLLILLACLVTVPPLGVPLLAAPQDDDEDPLDVGARETSRTRLILMDVVVLDKKDRTVPGLTQDDFEVVYRGAAAPIDTLDIDCPAGGLDDPRGKKPMETRDTIPAPGQGRKTVLLFDYLHLSGLGLARSFDAAFQAVEQHQGPGDSFMIAALTGGLRVEQRFTEDAAETRASLERMRYDMSLLGGSYMHGSSDGFLAGLTGLMQVLEQVPGHKSIVMFSQLGDRPLDDPFAEIAALATHSRSSIYPVDASGLPAESGFVHLTPLFTGAADPAFQGPRVNRIRFNTNVARMTDQGIRHRCGCSRNEDPRARGVGRYVSLARLASDTGGRATRGSNDLTLGVARAHRDASCVYTLGVYLREGEEDKVRGLRVDMKRPGLRALHPAKQVFRSEATKRTTKLRTAWISPQMYETGVVRAHAFPLRPRSRNRWDALLVVSFPMPLAERDGEPVQRVFGAVLNEGSTIVSEISRKVELTPDNAGVDGVSSVTFVEQVTLRPGSYQLTAVMTDPAKAEPHATQLNITIPAIPRGELFMVEPILGSPAGRNVVIRSDKPKKKRDPREDRVGDEDSFEPLLVRQLDGLRNAVALNQVCYVGSGRRVADFDSQIIRRELHREDGTQMGTIPPVEIALEQADKGRVHCQTLIDGLSTEALPDGAYAFVAEITEEGEREKGVRPAVLSFTIREGDLLPKTAQAR